MAEKESNKNEQKTKEAKTVDKTTKMKKFPHL